MSDYSSSSDTEIQLANSLGSFKASKNVLNQASSDERIIPYSTETRLKKSIHENIRLISSKMTEYLSSHEFQVRGSTGKAYTVKIGPKLDCSCRDQTTRKIHCKHLLYILLQEMKITDLKHPIYSTLTPSDQVLEDIFSKYHP
ncbi:hypothetical protein BD770DRAFT_376287 [Pilaira anomala]|nr:hypothetical protein BD770DRAFT_376287 [Pilaira anomala]